MKLYAEKTVIWMQTARHPGSQIARLETAFLNRLAIVILVLGASTNIAVAEQSPRAAIFQLTKNDLEAAQGLATQIATLSPGTRPEEASLLAECAYATTRQLRREYGVIWPPLFNNVLINSGIKKRGLCFQWAEDLLIALDALKLTSLELHWGEADAGTWQENNCVVVTGKGQPFRSGIILDCWRRSGHLYWRRVAVEKVLWVENRAYARFVRNKSAAAENGRAAYQTRTEPKQKSANIFRAAEN